MVNSKTTKEQLLKEYNALIKEHEKALKTIENQKIEIDRLRKTAKLTVEILNDYKLMSNLELTEKFKATCINETYLNDLLSRTKRFRLTISHNRNGITRIADWRKFPDGNLCCIISFDNGEIEEIWFFNAKELKSHE